ncbi:MAG: glycoside hydrolase family 38 C-terminal domain-containing protein [Actinomycetota bacterium]
MAGEELTSFLLRILASRPVNALSLRGMDYLYRRFAFLLPRDAEEGIENFFVRDLFGNVDLDGDGRPDAFRFGLTNGWYDQRLTGLELSIDGRRVAPDRLLVRWPRGEIAASGITSMDFPPGEAYEVIAPGVVLRDGIHFLEITVGMELVSQIVPLLPVVVRGGRADISILPDRLEEPEAWPTVALPTGTAHVVPHVHYDVEWLKTREVFERVGAGNLREMLRLMEADGEMTFVVDQVPHLEPFRRDDPEGFARLAGLVEEGRVEPVNGMYAEPDVNLLCGESLIRQSVAWQRYCLERFGRLSRCAWLIDSFGMSAQLPQILARSGTEALFFSRAPVEEGCPTEFLWEGPDGTRIFAHDMPRKYNVGHPMPRDRGRAMRWMLKGYRLLRGRSASDQVFYPCGVDHGRPQKEYGEMARAFNEEVEGARFEYSLPSRFVDAVPSESLPVVRGEFQRELWGTYSARASLKRLNRECEFALLDAGKMAAVASLRGAEYPGEALEEAWRDLMDCQFHDQICGCCTDEVADGMRRRFTRVLATSAEVMERAAGVLADPDASRDRFTVLAFNPLAWPVSSFVEFEFAPPPGWKGIALSSGGERLPVQVLDASRRADGSLEKLRAGFRPDLPGLGSAAFEITPGDGAQPPFEQMAGASGTTLSNGLLTVEVNPRTGLLGRVTLSNGTRFDMRGANRLTLERDFGNLYQAICLGTTYLHPRRVDSVRVAEPGPLRATVEVRGKVGRSRFVQRISLAAGSPRIDLETEVDFRDRGCRLRAVFPAGLSGGTWTHEVPFGWIRRPGHELPALNYTDLTLGNRGVTLVNHGIPGNKHDRGTIYLTLMRSTDKIYLWDAGPGALELGRQVFRYALYPHLGGPVEAGSTARACERNNGPRAFVVRGAPRGVGAGALECDDLNVLVTALERRGDTVMARLSEMGGEDRTVGLRLGWEASGAWKADLLEHKEQELALNGTALEVPLGKFEIATVLFD